MQHLGLLNYKSLGKKFHLRNWVLALVGFEKRFLNLVYMEKIEMFFLVNGIWVVRVFKMDFIVWEKFKF